MKTAKEIFEENWQCIPSYGDDNARVIYEIYSIASMQEYADQFKCKWHKWDGENWPSHSGEFEETTKTVLLKCQTIDQYNKIFYSTGYVDDFGSGDPSWKVHDVVFNKRGFKILSWKYINE